ncbi:hypothetical protein EV196_101121 [Mariniflexile fucanivorans]|uniref:Uncharacterized protein n=1 Tax=Mariniflexile fucanivorans TaxID=264023 RepID=A0A4R1RRW3_9FLAO|nr:hypothetical protein [Mariniflexile fucanivorans]TCL68702.1 hypothetical protein EV196_101121 [Mariniflexile fucanivorans]
MLCHYEGGTTEVICMLLPRHYEGGTTEVICWLVTLKTFLARWIEQEDKEVIEGYYKRYIFVDSEEATDNLFINKYRNELIGE